MMVAKAAQRADGRTNLILRVVITFGMAFNLGTSGMHLREFSEPLGS